MSYPPYRSFPNSPKPPSALTGGYVTPHGEDQLRAIPKSEFHRPPNKDFWKWTQDALPGDPGYKPTLEENMSNPMGGMAAVGGFSPLELGVMGGAMAIPAGIAAYKWWNSGGSDPSEPRYGRPGDPPHPNDGPTKQLSDFFMRSGELRKNMIGKPWTAPED